MYCIALSGLWSWSKGNKELISDFDLFAFEGREVFLVPNNDWQTPNIHGYKKNLTQAVYNIIDSFNSFMIKIEQKKQEKNMHRSRYVFLAMFIALIVGSGCQKKEGDEPTKYQSQAGLERLTEQAAKQQGGNSGSDPGNPAFDNSIEVEGKAPEVRDLDRIIVPVLKSLFGDARIISESEKPETQKDGEVVENQFTYVVRKHMVPKDGESLHAALCAAHFGKSPRLGSKPTIWSGGALMSLFKTTRLRTYSLVIKLDPKKQQLIVESYRLGSRYDRLM